MKSTMGSLDCERSLAEKALMSRFQASAESENNLKWISTYWNRRELRLIRSFEKDSEESSEKSNKKKREKKSQEELDLEEGRNRELLEQELKKEEVGFPVWTQENPGEIAGYNDFRKILPEKDEILESLGLGKNGPLVPPPVEFSVVPYPAQRMAPNLNSGQG